MLPIAPMLLVHRSKSDPLPSVLGQNENPPFSSLYQLPPGATFVAGPGTELAKNPTLLIPWESSDRPVSQGGFIDFLDRS